MAKRLNYALASDAGGRLRLIGGHGAIAEALDSVAHLVDDGGAMFDLLLGDHLAKVVTFGIVEIENVGSVVRFGVEIVAHGGAGAFNGATFGVDNVGEEREAVASFVLSDVAGAGSFNLFRGGNEDGRFALTGDPITFIRFCIEGEKGGKVGFHRLVFFNGEGKDSKKEDERKRDNSKERENLEQANGDHN